MKRRLAATLLVVAAASPATWTFACSSFGADSGPAAVADGGEGGASADTAAEAGSAAPGFRGQSVTPFTLTKDLTLRRPSETMRNDVVFAAVFARNGNRFGLPPGWTVIDQKTTCDGGGAQWVVHLAADDDPVDWVFPGTDRAPPAENFPGVAGIAVAYGGLARSEPEAQRSVTHPSVPYVIPSVETLTDGALLVASVVLGESAGNWTTPEGMVLRADVSRLAIFDGIRATKGATPARSGSATPDVCYASLLVAFGPR